VASSSDCLAALVRTSMHSWKTCENSPQSWFLRSLTFCETMSSAEKSKISSLHPATHQRFRSPHGGPDTQSSGGGGALGLA
jgi:hypothetical protein